MNQNMHKPVLLHESIDNLLLSTGDIYLDGTLGGGGHSALVAERFGSSVTIVGIDRSLDAVKRSEERLRALGAYAHLEVESFRNLDKVLETFKIHKVDAILLDLGISSDQLDASGRGFSFQRDEPLLMTMVDQPGEESLTAAYIVNNFDQATLELIIKGFGEERYARRIAEEIVNRRQEKPFETTFELVDAIRAAIRPDNSFGRAQVFYEGGRLHPATRTFQALRIATNEELIALEEGLEKGFKALAVGGRFAVISFHSLEDRVVKNFFRDKAHEDRAILVTKKPIVPSVEETRDNPRSRSAKLRVLEKTR